eukprot:8954-Eustigmatos_ZCMA.PRE.1
MSTITGVISVTRFTMSTLERHGSCRYDSPAAIRLSSPTATLCLHSMHFVDRTYVCTEYPLQQ